jgi:tetratricopeptide (TPR) repeat protein
VTEIPLVRRIAIALLALTVSALLVRGSIASAMVTRGDDLGRAGDGARAIALYRRALMVDPRSAVAADRLTFALIMHGGSETARKAYAVAEDALRYAGADALLLADRGFAAERLGRWGDAERSFLLAARAARDPRYFHLAAQMARRGNDNAAARRHLRAAIALDSGYLPARAALRRLGE